MKSQRRILKFLIILIPTLLIIHLIKEETYKISHLKIMNKSLIIGIILTKIRKIIDLINLLDKTKSLVITALFHRKATILGPLLAM